MNQSVKGLVIDTSPKGEINVLTPNGEFLKFKWTKGALPQIGSEVEIQIPVTATRKKFYQQKSVLALAASFLLFFALIPLIGNLLLPGYTQVVAYVSVDINPSIELGLDKNGKVIEISGLNEDGSFLVKDLNLTNLPVKKAIEEITQKAILEKFISLEKENSILVTISNGENIPPKLKQLDQVINQTLDKNKIKGEAEVLEVSADVHEHAKSLGLSPGKYVVLMEAVDEGLEVDLEDMQRNSIVKAIKNAGGIPGQLISRAQNHKNEIRKLEEKVQEKLKSKIENQNNKDLAKDENEDEEKESKNRIQKQEPQQKKQGLNEQKEETIEDLTESAQDESEEDSEVEEQNDNEKPDKSDFSNGNMGEKKGPKR